MPPRTWSHDREAAVRALETRGDAAAGAFATWAVWTVDGIYHLVDVHDDLFTSGGSFHGHHPDVVEITHARWATGSAITALDLCAGVLGRLHCDQTGDHLLDLRHLDPGEKKSGTRRYAQLPTAAQKWVDSVVGDPDYRVVLNARMPFTHARLARTLSARSGGAPTPIGPRDRTAFHVDGQAVESTDLIAKSKDLAARHVDAFLGAALAGA